MSQGGIISAVIPFESAADTSNVILKNVACLASVYIGAVVSLDATGTAFNSLADSEANSNMVGVCEAKTTTTLCDIRVLGTTTTIFSGLDPSKEYFLSDSIAGAIQTTVPTTSGHIVLKIGQPFSATRMIVLKGQRSKRL
jgi:hypothetical protein